MRLILCFSTVLIVNILTPDASAQCSRRNASNFGRINTFSPRPNSFSSPTSQRFGFSASSSFQLARLQSQLAQQRYANTQFQYLQALASQSQLAAYNSARPNHVFKVTSDFASNEPIPLPGKESERKINRIERLRSKNAQKAFAAGEKAEGNGRPDRARAHYERAVKIAGDSSLIFQKAEAAIHRLHGHGPVSLENGNSHVETSNSGWTPSQ